MNAFSDLQLRVKSAKAAKAEARALVAERAAARALQKAKRAAVEASSAAPAEPATVPVTLKVTTFMKVKAWWLRTVLGSEFRGWLGTRKK